MLASNSDDEDAYDDGFDEEDEDDEKKVENIKKALLREKENANKVVQRIKPSSNSDQKRVLKIGPGSGKGTVTMAQITREVNEMDPSQLIMPQANQGLPNTGGAKSIVIGQAKKQFKAQVPLQTI